MRLIPALGTMVLYFSLDSTVQADSLISGPQVDERVYSFSVTICGGHPGRWKIGYKIAS